MIESDADRLSQIRAKAVMGDHTSTAREDIAFLLNQLDRREMQKPAALSYLRECLNNNKYPATSDMIAVIDELEACRAAHIKDLEEIDNLLSAAGAILLAATTATRTRGVSSDD